MTSDSAAHRSILTTTRPAPGPRATPTVAHGSDTDADTDASPGWARPALIALLVGTAVLYLWGLDKSGWANSFYSAAVQAGSASWKAFFFGASDAASSITVDKTPLALWPMALSVRIFGLSSWSILAPQALEGVLTVWLLHNTVRRTTGSAGAALLGGLTMALTPVAVLMFKFNNPDAMLMLLLTASVYATMRALEATRRRAAGATGHPVRWAALVGVLVGLAFLAKMLQAFLVLPALAVVYLVAAQTGFWKRVGHLLVAFAAMIASAGWWIAVVSLWPASSRPYIGGSQDNSILELTLGYNGFGRLNGNETGSVGGGGGGNGAGNGGGMWGNTGLLRLFNTEIGGQVAWLLPAALVLLGAGLWFTRSRARTDAVRAGFVVWGLWLLVTGLTFSLMAGIFHAYYTVALAPAIGALVGMGAWILWRHRSSVVALALATLTVSMTSVLAFYLLGRSADFVPWLRWVVLVVGILSALAVVGVGRFSRRLTLAVGAGVLVATLAGPASYAVQTATTGHSGSIVDAGPSTGSNGPGGGGGPGAGGQRFGSRGPQGLQLGQGQAQGARPGGTGGGPGGGAGGGAGGLLNGSTASTALTSLLEKDASGYTWVAAAVGSNNASGYQLATQQPVMAIGGFNGSDPSPTLAQFKAYVAAGKIHYFIASSVGMGGQRGGSGAASQIAAWVADNFTAATVGGTTVYDLTGAASSTSGTTA